MGREFVPLFDEWAESYDHTVSGFDEEYKEVFHNYDKILEAVALRSTGNVLEFGVGTGNLTEKLITAGRKVFGVEPSESMRQKAGARFEKLPLFDGDFLHFPEFPEKINSIVSTYAFHHLTDVEKELAVRKYSEILDVNDRIIFADTAFIDEKDKEKKQKAAKEQGFENLLEDLQREYYTTLDVLKKIFNDNGFDVSFEKLNSYVWLMEAVKTAQK